MTHQEQIQNLIQDGYTFFVNHSGGKDSQAMLIKLLDLGIPRNQLVIIHAELPGVDWPGIREHINKYNHLGLDTIYCRAGKTLLDMVESRGMFPSPQYRQCTSDLKRDPINKAIRAWCKETGKTKVVSCLGIRAQESTSRSKQNPFKLDTRMSKAGRTVYTWMPIFDMLEDEVFSTIRQASQEPHQAYKAGMSRLSCCFCIMASKQDLRTAKALKPQLFQEYVDLEKKIGHTMFNGSDLETYVN